MVEKSHTGLWPSLYDPFRTFGQKLAEFLSPASDAKLADDTYTITMELPGVAGGDVELTVKDAVVTVRGEKKTEREEEGDTWYFTERQYGAFTRSFRLPPDADETGVGADLKDGVLTITVPRTEPKAEDERKVEITKS